MKHPRIAVVIPTRDRVQDLKHVLGSLLTQTVIPDQIIVVDNNSNDETKQVVELIAKVSRAQVSYCHEKKPGYPFVYNKGLAVANSDWVAFLDDDCVVKYDWYQQLVKNIRKNSKANVILGSSESLFKNDSLALAESFIKNLGLNKINQKGLVLDFEILNSKNIAYDKNFLNQHKIRFNESLTENGSGSSEDCDLGMQIQKAGGLAIFKPEIKVFHKEEININSYYVKLIERTRDHLVYKQQWQKYRRDKKFKKLSLVEVIKSFKNFLSVKKISFMQTLVVAFHVSCSFFLKKIIHLKYAN